jgi:hypothetical protein
LNAERTGARLTIRIAGLHQALGEALSAAHPAIAERLEQDEPERIHVGPCTDGGDLRIELLRSGIRRGEHHDVSHALRERGHSERSVAQDLRHPEIEHLHAVTFPRGREEEIARLHVAVNDPVRVGIGERFGSRREDAHHLFDRPPREVGIASLAKIFREREALEPLEHHEESELPRGGGFRRSAGDAADDVEVPLRQAVRDPTLVPEAIRELFVRVLEMLFGHLEDLDRNGLIEP